MVWLAVVRGSSFANISLFVFRLLAAWCGWSRSRIASSCIVLDHISLIGNDLAMPLPTKVTLSNEGARRLPVRPRFTALAVETGPALVGLAQLHELVDQSMPL